MKTISVKVYEFDELDDKAKERARDWYRECSANDEWWEFMFEDFQTIAQILGIEIKQRPVKLMNDKTRYDPAIYFSGFSSQGDGACFEGTYQYAKGSLEKIKSHAPEDKELHRIAQELQGLQKEHSYKLSASVTHTGHYSHKYSTSIETMNGDDYADKEVNEAMAEVLRDFMEWIYRQLEKEHEYHNSDEQVAENIQANEYEFYADGKRAVIGG